MGRLMVVACSSVMVLGFGNSLASDHDEAYDLLRFGEILPLEEILKISRKQIQGYILEVELEHDDGQLIYEIEILDKKGITWEMELDARTGQIIKQEQD